APVHRLVDAAREGKLARRTNVTRVVHPALGQVGGRVNLLHHLAGGGDEILRRQPRPRWRSRRVGRPLTLHICTHTDLLAGPFPSLMARQRGRTSATVARPIAPAIVTACAERLPRVPIRKAG